MHSLYSYKIHQSCVIIALALIIGCGTLTAHADTRQDALRAVSALQSSDAMRRFPDDFKSMSDALARGEQYLQGSDTVSADRYFLLTIQKARIIESLLNTPLTATLHTPTGSMSQSLQPAGAETVNQQQPVESSITETTGDEQDSETIPSSHLVGKASTYTVVKGDTLRLVAAKLGVSRQQLAKFNSLGSKAALKVGQELKYNNRRIIPQRMRDGIVVNIPDRMLYYFQQGKLVRSLPVALGTATKNEKYVWQTPTGKFKITAKQKDPTWYVPPSIQTEMEEQGKEVIISIPPGPDNPLGKYAIKTSLPGILIHSTTKPWSIYSFASHGCIRVYPDHMEDLFKEIKVNTLGEIIYRPVKLAVTESGRILMEVHQDVYNKSGGLAAEAKKLVEKHKLKDQVDWNKFESVLQQKSGVAEDITL